MKVLDLIWSSDSRRPSHRRQGSHDLRRGPAQLLIFVSRCSAKTRVLYAFYLDSPASDAKPRDDGPENALVQQNAARWMVFVHGQLREILQETRTHESVRIMANSIKRVLETILVVDDNEAVLKIVVAILERANFRVLSADSGSVALMLAEETDGKIDLLLSDVEMPQMSGSDLGEMLKKTRPDLHVMLMSGAANGNLLVLNYGWAYIQKPLVAVKLVQMITDVLHSPNRSQPGGHEFDKRKNSSGNA